MLFLRAADILQQKLQYGADATAATFGKTAALEDV